MADPAAATVSALQCNFCGKGIDECTTLVEGQTAYICDECVDTAAVVVAEKRAKQSITGITELDQLRLRHDALQRHVGKQGLQLREIKVQCDVLRRLLAEV